MFPDRYESGIFGKMSSRDRKWPVEGRGAKSLSLPTTSRTRATAPPHSGEKDTTPVAKNAQTFKRHRKKPKRDQVMWFRWAAAFLCFCANKEPWAGLLNYHLFRSEEPLGRRLIGLHVIFSSYLIYYRTKANLSQRNQPGLASNSNERKQ